MDLESPVVECANCCCAAEVVVAWISKLKKTKKKNKINKKKMSVMEHIGIPPHLQVVSKFIIIN